MRPQSQERAPENPTEEIVCPSCMHRNAPIVDFCEQCGAPVGAYTTTDPWKSIGAEGFFFRKALSGPMTGVRLIGVWMVLLPFLLIPVLYLAFEGAMSAAVLGVVFGAVVAFFVGRKLYRVTRDYLTRSGEPPAPGPF